VIGFSAGGHLAGHAALAAESSAPERPDFAILAYPVVSMTTTPHVRSREVLVPGDAQLAAEVSLERLVRADAPPMFVWHTDADPVVPVEHSYLLGQALATAGIAHELHVFPGDVHGVGMDADGPAAAWTVLCAQWLERSDPAGTGAR
jgi:acetyl esterase/lipase